MGRPAQVKARAAMARPAFIEGLGFGETSKSDPKEAGSLRKPPPRSGSRYTVATSPRVHVGLDSRFVTRKPFNSLA